MTEAKEVIVPNSDNPLLQINSVKIDRTNYLVWFRSCLLFIKTRSLQGYIIDNVKKSGISSLEYNRWDSENSLIMSWLINSMQFYITRTYLLLNTTAKRWNAVSLIYSQVDNYA